MEVFIRSYLPSQYLGIFRIHRHFVHYNFPVGKLRYLSGVGRKGKDST